MKPTYNQQFDLLTRAYINNEVFPMSPCACFVGNILGNTKDWARLRYSKDQIMTPNKPGLMDPYYNFYTMEEICDLENIFLDSILYICFPVPTENSLFDAFERTLEKLKEIHISKGEVIEDTPVFVKRKLEMA